MDIIETGLKDVKICRTKVLGGDRVSFMETFRKNQFSEKIGDCEFVQDNRTRSGRGVLRGLHYQIRHLQGKLVQVIAGEVFS